MYTLQDLSKIKVLLSTKDFAKKMGWSAEYALQHARGHVDPRTGRKCTMPAGWIAIPPEENFYGRRWLFFQQAAGESLPPVPIDPPERPVGKVLDDTDIVKVGLANLRAEVASQVLGRMFPSVLEVNRELLIRSLLAVIDRSLDLVSDAELSERLVERWQHGVTIASTSDIANSLPVLDAGRALVLSPPMLQSASGLMRQLGEFYRAAVKSGDPMEVALTFRPDGSWSLNGRGAIEESLPADLLVDLSAIGSTLGDLFRYAWWWQYVCKKAWSASLAVAKRRGVTIQKGKDKAMQHYLEGFLNMPLVQRHPCYLALLARCLHCCQPKPNPRPNKRYCQDGHRAEHSKWLISLAAMEPEQAENAIERRVIKILH